MGMFDKDAMAMFGYPVRRRRVMDCQLSNGSTFAKVPVEPVAGKLTPSIRPKAPDRPFELDPEPRPMVLVLFKRTALGARELEGRSP